MRPQALLASLLLVCCGGCASVSGVDTALKAPAVAAKAAADVTVLSEQDVLKFIALGSAQYDGQLTLANLICYPAIGPDVVISNLDTFSDSLAAIDAVAAKPKDAGYGAILARIQEDDRAGAKDYESERRAAIKKRDAARGRCAALFGDDTAASTHIVVPPPGRAAGAALPASATFAAIGALVTSVLSAAEQMKRDAAVKATVRHLAPQMQAAIGSLEAPRNDGFGTQVAYAATGGAAETMDRTCLGATISLHRWWVAKNVEARWNELSACRGKHAANACIANPYFQNVATDLSAAVLQYRALAAVDTDQVIASLHKGVSAAQSAADAKTLSAMIDSLSEVGGALGSVGKGVEGLEKTRSR